MLYVYYNRELDEDYLPVVEIPYFKGSLHIQVSTFVPRCEICIRCNCNIDRTTRIILKLKTIALSHARRCHGLHRAFIGGNIRIYLSPSVGILCMYSSRERDVGQYPVEEIPDFKGSLHIPVTTSFPVVRWLSLAIVISSERPG